MTSPRARERLVDRLREAGIRDSRVLDAMREVPRHIFMDEAFAVRAYEDTALPIGHGQTISQPMIVARMSEALLRGGVPRKVLEIGTGSGYQTAVLASLIPQVFTIERIGALQERARERLRLIGVSNVRFLHGDGAKGWASLAPFDAILVTAAPEEVPRALLDQLAEGGRMVIPVGGQGGAQQLLLIRRIQGVFRPEVLDQVLFVPFVAGELA
jgi:protein-L-isoaspartate(D-aspartate) O-methyltransferase